MCLETIEFALTKNSKGFYGVGYKNMCPKDVTINKWLRAKSRNKDDDGFIRATDYSTYYPGFHIFTNLNDAQRYIDGSIYEVHYRNVLAFGKNEVSYDYSGPCVIAQYIRYVRCLEKGTCCDD